MIIKENLFIFMILLILLIGCENSNKKNKIFLDFYLGMDKEKYEDLIDTLDNKEVIYSRHLKEKKYYYDFDLIKNNPTTVQINGSFYNEYKYLQNLKLDFGYISKGYILSGPSFNNFTNCNDINRTLSVYVEKYGIPKKFKDDEVYPSSSIKILDLVSENDIDRNRVFYWDKENFKIIFYLGRSDDESKYCHDAFIEYDLDFFAKEKLDKIHYEKKRKLELIKKKKAKDNI